MRSGAGEQQFHDQFYAAEAQRIFASRLYRHLLQQQVEFLVAAMPDLRAGRMLSLGCGDGRRELALAPHAGHIVGLDISPVAIDHARAGAAALGLDNVEFHVADLDGWQDGSRSYDAVLCAGILHHLDDAQIRALLAALHAALAAGGRFVSIDPNAGRAVNLFKPLFRRAYDRYRSADERDLRPAYLVELLCAAGFRDPEVHFTDAFISPLAWLFPRLTAPVAPALARLDRLLVQVPVLNRLSSGFAVLARRAE